MDANADRKIEATEVPVQFRELFHQIEDRLGGTPDGVLSQREITQSAPKLSHLALRVTRRMDIDVELEIALLPKQQWQALQNLLAPRRRGDYLADPEQAREFFARLDANNDGQITAAEVPEQLAGRFDQLLERADRNHNSQISLQELPCAVSPNPTLRGRSPLARRATIRHHALAQAVGSKPRSAAQPRRGSAPDGRAIRPDRRRWQWPTQSRRAASRRRTTQSHTARRRTSPTKSQVEKIARELIFLHK